MEIDLTLPQYAAMTSPAKIVVFISGIGSGKSLVAGWWTLERAKVAGSLGLAVAKDARQMKLATLPRLQEAWERAGYIQDEHYVVNRRPPRHWGVRAFTDLGSANLLTWYWGSYLVLGGTENYESHRGPAFDYVMGDELRGWRDIGGALNVLVGRLRGQAYRRAGLVSPMLLVTSPLDDPEELEAYTGGERVEVIRGTTFDNLRNLPADYIRTQRDTLDKLTYRREVLGEDVAMGGMRACWAFAFERFPNGNIIRCDFDPDADLYLCHDFNSSALRPMSTVGYQPIGRLNGRYVVTCSWINFRTQTPTQCEIVLADLVAWGFRGRLFIRGDATGEHANRGSAATMSDYMWIERTFKPGPDDTEKQWQYMGRRTPRTLRVKNRMEALNAQFENERGWRNMLVDDRQEAVLTAARKLKLAANGHDLEETMHNDPISALSYGPYADHPVHLPKATSRQT